jgi:membrane associated rhomboid family serine protease
MSNVRGISDLRRQQEAQRERQRLVDSEMHPPRQYPILGYGFQLGSAEEARKESFGQMLTLIFCPHFRYLSFIFIITTLQVIIYFTTVFYDYDTSKFFQPTTDSLNDFGAKNPERMQENYELWRWFTPVMLHGDLLHLTFNLIMQLILGFRLEPTVGPWITIAIYWLSGFGGVILSCLGSPDSLSVGASGALFGILAAMIAWIMINWSSLEHDLYRTVTLVWLVVLLVFNLLMGFVIFI